MTATVVGGVLLHHTSPARVVDVSSRAEPGDQQSAALRVGKVTTPVPRHQDVSRSSERSAPSAYRVQPGQTLHLTPTARLQIAAEKKAARRARRAAMIKNSSFLVGTLNVLGSQHTAGSGGFGPGTARAYREASLIRARGIDLIGLQEVQHDQGAVFTAQLPGYQVWPRESLGRQGYRLQMAWRSDRFSLVEGHQISYLFDHMRIPLPYALLRDRQTGAEFWFVNAHNSPEGLQAERLVSSGIEARLVRDLKATGHPVILTGDLNEHAPVMCRLGATAGLKSANGGYYSGGCHMPVGPLRIDWLLGSSAVNFTSYRQDGATRAGGMSDHYLILAEAALTDGGGATQ